jgi:hypothetical protein
MTYEHLERGTCAACNRPDRWLYAAKDRSVRQVCGPCVQRRELGYVFRDPRLRDQVVIIDRPCIRGHRDNWYYDAWVKHWRCRTCRNEREQEKRAANDNTQRAA